MKNFIISWCQLQFYKFMDQVEKFIAENYADIDCDEDENHNVTECRICSQIQSKVNTSGKDVIYGVTQKLKANPMQEPVRISKQHLKRAPGVLPKSTFVAQSRTKHDLKKSMFNKLTQVREQKATIAANNERARQLYLERIEHERAEVEGRQPMFIGPIGINGFQNDSLHQPTESRLKDSVIDSTLGVVPQEIDLSKQGPETLLASANLAQDKHSKIESNQVTTAKISNIQKDSILIEEKQNQDIQEVIEKDNLQQSAVFELTDRKQNSEGSDGLQEPINPNSDLAKLKFELNQASYRQSSAGRNKENMMNVTDAMDANELCNLGINDEFLLANQNFDQQQKLNEVVMNIESGEEGQSYQGIDHESIKLGGQNQFIQVTESMSPQSLQFKNIGKNNYLSRLSQSRKFSGANGGRYQRNFSAMAQSQQIGKGAMKNMMETTSQTQTKYGTDLQSDQRASDVSPDEGQSQIVYTQNQYTNMMLEKLARKQQDLKLKSMSNQAMFKQADELRPNIIQHFGQSSTPSNLENQLRFSKRVMSGKLRPSTFRQSYGKNATILSNSNQPRVTTVQKKLRQGNSSLITSDVFHKQRIELNRTTISNKRNQIQFQRPSRAYRTGYNSIDTTIDDSLKADTKEVKAFINFQDIEENQRNVKADGFNTIQMNRESGLNFTRFNKGNYQRLLSQKRAKKGLSNITLNSSQQDNILRQSISLKPKQKSQTRNLSPDIQDQAISIPDSKTMTISVERTEPIIEKKQQVSPLKLKSPSQDLLNVSPQKQTPQLPAQSSELLQLARPVSSTAILPQEGPKITISPRLKADVELKKSLAGVSVFSQLQRRLDQTDGEVREKEEKLRQLNYELAMIKCDINSGLENNKIDFMIFEKIRAMREERVKSVASETEKTQSQDQKGVGSPLDKIKSVLQKRVEAFQMGNVLFQNEAVQPEKSQDVEVTSMSMIESVEQKVSSNIDMLDLDSPKVEKEPSEILARGYNGAANRAKSKSRSPTKRFQLIDKATKISQKISQLKSVIHEQDEKIKTEELLSERYKFKIEQEQKEIIALKLKTLGPEGIQKEHNSYQKVAYSFERLQLINKARKNISTDLISQKQKEAKEKMRKLEEILSDRVKILIKESKNSDKIKEIINQKNDRISTIKQKMKDIKVRNKANEEKKHAVIAQIDSKMVEIRFIRQLQILVGLQNIMKTMQNVNISKEEILPQLNDYSILAKSISQIIEKINMCILSSPRSLAKSPQRGRDSDQKELQIKKRKSSKKSRKDVEQSLSPASHRSHRTPRGVPKNKNKLNDPEERLQAFMEQNELVQPVWNELKSSLSDSELENLELVNFGFLLEMIEDQAMQQESLVSIKRLLIEENVEKIKILKDSQAFLEFFETELKDTENTNNQQFQHLLEGKTLNQLIFESNNNLSQYKIQRQLETKEKSQQFCLQTFLMSQVIFTRSSIIIHQCQRMVGSEKPLEFSEEQSEIIDQYNKLQKQLHKARQRQLRSQFSDPNNISKRMSNQQCSNEQHNLALKSLKSSEDVSNRSSVLTQKQMKLNMQSNAAIEEKDEFSPDDSGSIINFPEVEIKNKNEYMSEGQQLIGSLDISTKLGNIKKLYQQLKSVFLGEDHLANIDQQIERSEYHQIKNFVCPLTEDLITMPLQIQSLHRSESQLFSISGIMQFEAQKINTIIKRRIKKKEIHNDCGFDTQNTNQTHVTEEDDYFDHATHAINQNALTHGWVKSQKRIAIHNDSKTNSPQNLPKAQILQNFRDDVQTLQIYEREEAEFTQKYKSNVTKTFNRFEQIRVNRHKHKKHGHGHGHQQRHIDELDTFRALKLEKFESDLDYKIKLAKLKELQSGQAKKKTRTSSAAMLSDKSPKKKQESQDLAHIMGQSPKNVTSQNNFNLKQPLSFTDAASSAPRLNKRFNVKAMKFAKEMGKDQRFINIQPPKPKEQSQVVKILLKRYPELLKYNFFTESEDDRTKRSNSADDADIL